jgi:hypothetical protein
MLTLDRRRGGEAWDLMGGPRRAFGLQSAELRHNRGKIPGTIVSAPGCQQDGQDRR